MFSSAAVGALLLAATLNGAFGIRSSGATNPGISRGEVLVSTPAATCASLAVSDCFDLTDANADGDCSDDLQKGFNTIYAANPTAATLTFTTQLTSTCNLNTRVRMCSSATPATYTGTSTVPACDGGAFVPVIRFAGAWSDPARHLISKCATTTSGTKPQGCLWIGDAFNDASFANLIQVKMDAGSAIAIEQFTADPNLLAPLDVAFPFLCDGCTSPAATWIRVAPIPSNRGPAVGPYPPPQFAGNSMNIELATPAFDPGAGSLWAWNDYVTVIGNSNVMTGQSWNTPVELGLSPSGTNNFYTSGECKCSWDAAWATTYTCGLTIDSGFRSTIVAKLAKTGVSAAYYDSFTFNGYLNTADDTAAGMYLGSGGCAGSALSPPYTPRARSTTFNGTLMAPANTLNAAIRASNNDASNGPWSIGANARIYYRIPKSSALADIDKMGWMCTPQNPYLSSVTISSGAQFVGNFGWMMAVGYPSTVPTEKSQCVVTAPGSAGGSRLAPAAGQPTLTSGTWCLDFTTGLWASCAGAATKRTSASDTILAWTKWTIGGAAVSGGKTCAMKVQVDGASPRCASCGPSGKTDATGLFSYGYGSAGLVNAADAVQYPNIDEVITGSYWQMQLTGAANCAWNADATLTWSEYPAL